jgi:hypothetical protein
MLKTNNVNDIHTKVEALLTKMSQKVWSCWTWLASSTTLFISLSPRSILHATQLIVQSMFGQKFTVSTHLSHLPIVDYEDYISILYSWEAMCDCDTCAALFCFVQCFLNNLMKWILMLFSYNTITFLKLRWVLTVRLFYLQIFISINFSLFSLNMEHSHVHKA